MEKVIQIEKKYPHITFITLNRPEKRNALNIVLMEALCSAVETASRDRDQRVLVVKGAGPSFCAGLDLEEALELSTAERAANLFAKVILSLVESPLVTIAAVQGAAIAGGAGLVSACDLVVSSENARFGYPETRRGLVAALVMTLLERQIHERHIKELLLTGENIDAERALKMGLINRIVPIQNLYDEALKMANAVLCGAPEATKMSKKLLSELHPFLLIQAIDIAKKYHIEARRSEEASEGIASFLENRNPNWQKKL